MQCRECPSSLDGGPVAALSYGADGPVPWRWVTDELRALDERTLLGMTVINLPLLREMIQAKEAFEEAKAAQDADKVGRILTYAEGKVKK